VPTALPATSPPTFPAAAAAQNTHTTTLRVLDFLLTECQGLSIDLAALKKVA
jgi:hypothetical protein